MWWVGTYSTCRRCIPGNVCPDTGFPRADVESDFLRVRRRQVLARLAARLRLGPDDVNMILPFDEVVGALGWVGERDLGLRTIQLDSIIGTVDSLRDFDRRFRPTTGAVRQRWERLALAQRQGASLPPIDVYRIGDAHFVRDGHHRVSIAIAGGQKTIEAYVVEIRTAVPAKGIRRRADLLLKSDERIFRSRVPLSEDQYEKLRVDKPWTYTVLGEAVEAWGFRCIQDDGRFVDRHEVATRWYTEEYEPVIRMLREAKLLGNEPEACTYLRVAKERYRLMRTHEWNDQVIRRLQKAAR